MIVAVLVRTTEPHRQSEALRAALGLTLRGAKVHVVIDAPVATSLAQRAIDTLRSFGHVVDADLTAVARADRVEVWT
ncbi:MAG: hypothetical protein NT062_00875 [Proteobacteria bacterium]|nr:hypothetical protein [Pseudomonadota bacterium]